MPTGYERDAERIYALIEHLTNRRRPAPPAGSTTFSHVAAVQRAGRGPVQGRPGADLRLQQRLPPLLQPASRPPLATLQRHRRFAVFAVAPRARAARGDRRAARDLHRRRADAGRRPAASLIRAAARLGLVTGLNTNGRRLADRRFAASLQAAGLDHVQITLESHRPRGPQRHDRRRFVRRDGPRHPKRRWPSGLHTITNTTLTRQNVDHAGRDSSSFSTGLGCAPSP